METSNYFETFKAQLDAMTEEEFFKLYDEIIAMNLGGISVEDYLVICGITDDDK